MTIQQIEYVLAVIDHGSFSKAADACFVTQPTLSSQIAKLEQELGIFLLDRLSRPVGPAPGAGEILQRARSAVKILHSIPALAEEKSSALSGELKVGIIPTLAPYLLPLFLENFMEKYPGLHLTFSELQSDIILEEIRDFRLDCGILALPAGAEGLDEIPLFFEEFTAYLPPGNRKSGRIEIRDLNRNELLLLNEGHCLRDQIIDLCGTSNERKHRKIEFETGSLESLIKLVDQGLGHTLLPELSVAGLNDERNSRVHPLGPEPPMRKIGLLFHPVYVRPKLLKYLSNAIIEGLPEHIRNRTTGKFLPWRRLSVEK